MNNKIYKRIHHNPNWQFNKYFQMFHLHKTKKFDYKHPEWMNSFINCSLKKKYMARFCNNPPDYNIDLSNECTKSIIQAKDRHIA